MAQSQKNLSDFEAEQFSLSQKIKNLLRRNYLLRNRLCHISPLKEKLSP